MNANQKTALDQAKRLALNIDGVTAVDFGTIYTGGKATRKSGIRFHVARKKAEDAIPAGQLLPKDIMGVPVDVVQASYEPHAAMPQPVPAPLNPRAAFDPILAGISIGNLDRAQTGTLGAIARDAAGAQYVLSNWHVLCANVACKPGETICQPGPFHAGVNPARPVAKLTRWASLSTGCDAAIAALNPDVRASAEVYGIGPRLRGIAQPRMHMHLIKCGATSTITHAKVDGLHGTYAMDYSGYGDQRRWMDGIRLVIDPAHPDDEVSLEGDSGALWVEAETMLAVALHFAGEDHLGPLADYAAAHPIDKVLKLLDLTPWTAQ